MNLLTVYVHPWEGIYMTKTTKTLDRFDNISYTIERDGQIIGYVRKACSGYHAEHLSGSYVPAPSIKKAIAILESQVATLAAR